MFPPRIGEYSLIIDEMLPFYQSNRKHLSLGVQVTREMRVEKLFKVNRRVESTERRAFAHDSINELRSFLFFSFFT